MNSNRENSTENGNNYRRTSKTKKRSSLIFENKNMPRPQLTFKDTIDNSENVWRPKITEKPNKVKPLAFNLLFTDDDKAIGYEHPYKEELKLYKPPSEFILPDPNTPTFPPSLNETKFTYIDTVALLDELIKHLETVKELAIDLEHHAYRTYQGITCLMQITTSEGGDFIIDTLALREYIYKFNVIFTDPTKVKVLHGAESDILWLQRDFNTYIVGLFDTHQAAKALKLPGLALKSLLIYYCNLYIDKKYQLADWRIRPLPQELIDYARMDTHYLIYIWRQMKRELLEAADEQSQLLLSIFEQSKQVCSLTYNKEIIREDSHMPMYIKSGKTFDARQMAALKMLYKWRDSQARLLDESPIYLLPNHMLLALADYLPCHVRDVKACCYPTPPIAKNNWRTITKMLLSCRQMSLWPKSPSRKSLVDIARPTTSYKLYGFSHLQNISNKQIKKVDNATLSTRDQPDISSIKDTNNNKDISRQLPVEPQPSTSKGVVHTTHPTTSYNVHGLPHLPDISNKQIKKVDNATLSTRDQPDISSIKDTNNNKDISRQLPVEPQPSTSKGVVHTTRPTTSYNVHGLPHLPDISKEQQMNVDNAVLLARNLKYQPDILALKDTSNSNENNNVLEKIEEEKRSEEEIAAISKGNELIEAEMPGKLHQAEEQIEYDTKKEWAKVNDVVVTDHVLLETKLQRKRKISSDKVESNNVSGRTVEDLTKETKPNDTSENKSNLEPMIYDNDNFKKFCSDSK
ncbi:exosome component 10-like [Galleria mellonella]|uniref:Exosome component 10-like n=1 Tax=Galleria mellonella TaxID=7137 RepID=A0ABM3MJV2_GALME|nr:exosome component 10-like [Galleria mellonella]XP_052751411.1 exosome component 10-like [Galleria mellonella]